MFGVYIILLFSLGLTYIGFLREDSWLITLSSFLLIVVGLYTMIHGFGDIIAFEYKYLFGVLFIFIGIYFGFRASIEAFKIK